jgi:hypothetical protein
MKKESFEACRAPVQPPNRPPPMTALALAACQKSGYIFLTGAIWMHTIRDDILDRIRNEGRGKVFIPKDFLDLGSRHAADQSLSRLVKSGDIERLGRGLYYYPRRNGRASSDPNIDEVASALARRTGSRVVPSGAVAAHRLGLSSQVPARPVYLTDGRTRQVWIGKTLIEIRHAAPKELPVGSQTAAMVFQALRFIGKEAVDDRVIAKIRKTLSPDLRRELLREINYTTDWIAAAVRQVASDEPKVLQEV